MSKNNISIIIAILFTITYLLIVRPAFAGITSTNFELKDYGFGAGGIATSSSTNFMFQGIAGEIESASLSSTNFRIGPGLTYTLQPNIPPAPTFTNPSNYYNKLKLVINTGGNSTDTTYAIAVSNSTSGLSTLGQDSFTAGGNVAITSHTPEIGGSWSGSGYDNSTSYRCYSGSGGGACDTTAYLTSVTLGDGDVYATHLASGQSYNGPIARITGNNWYLLATNEDMDLGTIGWTLYRITSGAKTSIATGTDGAVGFASLRLRLNVSGVSPTALKVKVWDPAGAEPGTWTWTGSDNTAGNQTSSGGIGIEADGSTTFGYGSIDDFLATSGSSQTSSSYVQADNTLGTSPVWQTYTSWGGASGVTLIGLDTGTTYSAQVAAKRGTFTQGGFGPTATAATINPTFTFSLQTTSQPSPPFSVYIGQLNAGAVTTSTDKITATISTNANNGGLVYLYGVNAGLKSTTAGNYNIGSVSNDLSSILEGYGVRGTNVTQTSGGPMELISPYNGAGNNVGIVDTAKRTLSDSTSQPVVNGQTSFELQAKAKNTTPSATDYTDTLTVIGTGSF